MKRETEHEERADHDAHLYNGHIRPIYDPHVVTARGTYTIP